MKFGYVDDRYVAYILIPPVPTDQPFQVARDFPKQNPLITQGQWWIRMGESKHEVTAVHGGKAGWPHPFSVAPYPLPSHWLAYHNALLAHPTVAEAPDFAELIPVLTNHGSDAMGELLELANEEQGGYRVVVLQGPAMSGKTTLAANLIRQLCNYNLDALEEIRSREEFLPPPFPVPLFLSLRHGRDWTLRSIQSRLVHRVNELGRFWDQRPQEPERLFEVPGERWLVCLDGLDEIWNEEDRRDFLGGLADFLSAWPRVTVLITSRPWIDLRDQLPDLHVVQLAPLTLQTIEEYVEGSVEQHAQKDVVLEFLSLIRRDSELLELCARPGLLVEALNSVMGERRSAWETAELAVTATSYEPPSPTTEPEPAAGFLDQAPTDLPAMVSADELIWEEPSEAVEVSEDLPLEGITEEPTVVDEETLQPSLTTGYLLRVLLEDTLWQREVQRQSLAQTTLGWWSSLCRFAFRANGHWQQFPYTLLHNELHDDRLVAFLLTLGFFRRVALETYTFLNNLLCAYLCARHIARPLCEATALLKRLVEPVRARTQTLLEDLYGPST